MKKYYYQLNKLGLILVMLGLLVGCNQQTDVDFDARLEALGIELPNVAKPVGDYQPYRIHNGMVYISQSALKDGEVIGAGIIKDDDDILRGQEAARQVVLNILAVVKEASGGTLNKIDKVIFLDGFVASSETFTNQSKIINAASNLLVEILGEQGEHARSSVGVRVLPLNSSVQITAMIALKT